MKDIKDKVEAVLFASGRKMHIDEISKLCRVKDTDLVKNALKELQNEYDGRGGPLLVLGEGDVWNLNVGERHLPLVQKIVSETELSKTLLETLAVIAWKQPIMQSDVIKVRTNKAYDHIHQLVEMGFLASKKYGRTRELKLTENFFKYFDIEGEKDIKDVFKDIEAKKDIIKKEAEAKRKLREDEKLKQEEEEIKQAEQDQRTSKEKIQELVTEAKKTMAEEESVEPQEENRETEENEEPMPRAEDKDTDGPEPEMPIIPVGIESEASEETAEQPEEEPSLEPETEKSLEEGVKGEIEKEEQEEEKKEENATS